MVKLRCNLGIFHLPLLFVVLIISVAGFGTWGFLRHWRFLVEIQLRLDQCVGLTAQDLKNKLNSLASDNHHIRRLRMAIQAAYAAVTPELIPPLRTTLNAVVAHQEVTLLGWRTTQIQWVVKQGCGKKGDIAFLLPDLKLIRKPSDFIGPQPLESAESPLSEYIIQLNHFPRAAAAQIEGNPSQIKSRVNYGEEFDQKNWTAHWTAPHSIPRTSPP